MAEGPDPSGRERLKEHELTDIDETGVEIGRGSYAVVLELHYRGLKCAGKKFHDYLVQKEGPSRKKCLIDECVTLSKTKHPNIVQFIGVYYPAGSTVPTLVMEYLPTTLAVTIDTHKHLPEEISYVILEDVALGLYYLHGSKPQIIHRDLSANNVLVTDNMRAKISDLGVAKMLNITPQQKVLMSKQPGTAAYMPPEAREEHPCYTTDIDIFSYGIMVMHVFCQEWPIPIDSSDLQPNDPDYEVKRRQKYLGKIGSEHQIWGLIMKCLSRAASRPDISRVLKKVREEKAKLEIYHGNKMKMVRERESLESDITRYIAQQKEQNLKISQLESQLAELEKEKQLNHTEKENLETKIEKLTSLNELKNGQINTKERHLSESKQELDLTTELFEKEKAEAKELKKRLQQKDSDTQKALHSLVRDRDQAWQDLTSGGQFHLLHGRALLKWEHVQQQESIPMTAPQCTIIDSTLYFGGGQTDNDKVAERKQVFAFDTNASISDNPIYKVPDCPVIHFGLGNIGGKLVAVGGRNPDNKDLTNEVHVLDKNQQGALEWNRGTIPSLSKPRARACIVSQSEDQTSTCIAACGGRIQNQDYEASSNIVEVYRKDSPRWDKVAPLPHPRAALRVTVLHNTAYLLGGFFDDMKGAGEPDCQSIILDNLFQENPREQGGWRVLKHVPSRSATPGHLCGTLLAVGGLMDGNKKPVLAFNPNTQMWVHIAILPKTISSATAAALPNGKLVIFGGWETKECRNREIFIGRVTGRMF